jgi:hypothetical protein
MGLKRSPQQSVCAVQPSDFRSIYASDDFALTVFVWAQASEVGCLFHRFALCTVTPCLQFGCVTRPVKNR